MPPIKLIKKVASFPEGKTDGTNVQVKEKSKKKAATKPAQVAEVPKVHVDTLVVGDVAAAVNAFGDDEPLVIVTDQHSPNNNELTDMLNVDHDAVTEFRAANSNLIKSNLGFVVLKDEANMIHYPLKEKTFTSFDCNECLLSVLYVFTNGIDDICFVPKDKKLFKNEFLSNTNLVVGSCINCIKAFEPYNFDNEVSFCVGHVCNDVEYSTNYDCTPEDAMRYCYDKQLLKVSRLCFEPILNEVQFELLEEMTSCYPEVQYAEIVEQPECSVLFSVIEANIVQDRIDHERHQMVINTTSMAKILPLFQNEYVCPQQATLATLIMNDINQYFDMNTDYFEINLTEQTCPSSALCLLMKNELFLVDDLLRYVIRILCLYDMNQESKNYGLDIVDSDCLRIYKL